MRMPLVKPSTTRREAGTFSKRPQWKKAAAAEEQQSRSGTTRSTLQVGRRRHQSQCASSVRALGIHLPTEASAGGEQARGVTPLATHLMQRTSDSEADQEPIARSRASASPAAAARRKRDVEDGDRCCPFQARPAADPWRTGSNTKSPSLPPKSFVLQRIVLRLDRSARGCTNVAPRMRTPTPERVRDHRTFRSEPRAPGTGVGWY